MNTFRILILEDDLRTLYLLLRGIYLLEEELLNESIDISIVIMSEYTQVEKYLKDIESNDFDLVLLDRDCKAGGSFHVLNIEKFGPEKIISISSVPQWNEEANDRGVQKIVHKDYENLDIFCENLLNEIREIII